MRNFVLFTAMVALSFGAKAQILSNAKISYRSYERYLSIADSLTNTQRFSSYDPIVIDHFYPADNEHYVFNADTLLCFEFNKNKTYPRSIICSTVKNCERINIISGSSAKFEDYNKSKYKKLSKYKRISEEDCSIEGYDCKAFMIKTNKGWQKIWLAQNISAPTQFKNAFVFIDGYWIVKKETYFKNQSVRVKLFKGLSEPENLNFAQVIKKHTKNNIQVKYSPILQNSKLPTEALEVGHTVPNFYYRDVFSNEIVDFYSTSSKSKYTAVEFWGSWCIPCLIATKKIKQMRNQFNTNKLAIISFNTHDRNVEKVQDIIKDKGMNWQHGYSTEKIISLLNKKGSYPTMVIINQSNEVVFIGNPNTDNDQIISMIN